ncbi:MAG: acyl-CoA dehydrogenase family protein [Acidimicrobiales bacterium]
MTAIQGLDRKNPFLTSEKIAFRDEIRRFVEKEAGREQVRGWDRNREFPYALFEKIAALGWRGLGIPEEYGGTPADLIVSCLVTEELARYSNYLGDDYALGMWGARNINRWGTEEQKRQYLPAFIRGDIRFSFSLTEADSGSDAASLTTTAKRSGDSWVINGQKMFSTAADKDNNYIFLAVRTSKEARKQEGISIFIVPNDAKGLTILPLKDFLAARIQGTTQLFLEDVVVPDDALLGPLGGGWDIIRWHLAIERAMIAASFVGAAQGAIDLTITNVKERQRFGRRVSDFQVVRHMLADMQMQVDAARLLTYRVAVLANAGDRLCEEEASMAKAYSSEAYFKVATDGMQLLGGYANDPQFDMERYFRDAKQSMVGGGSSQIQRDIIARCMGI